MRVAVIYFRSSLPSEMVGKESLQYKPIFVPGSCGPQGCTPRIFVGYIRIEIVKDDVVAAFDKAKPRPGETVLNSVELQRTT